MKITFILRDKTPAFFETLATMNDLVKLAYLLERSAKPEYSITVKIGNGSFRDRADFNAARRSLTPESVSYRLEPRAGYKLAVFET